jgi:HAD superfamily hydrolase (TIGR01509 family)
MIAVGFDFDHTLGVDHSLEREAYVRFAAELGVKLSLEEAEHQKLVDDLLVQFRAAHLTLDAATEVFITALGEVEGAARLISSPGTRYREICYGLVNEMVRPLEGAADLIGALADAGIPSAILTNGWSPLQQLKIARAIGEFPGPILVSDQLGAIKPAEEAFARLAEALDTARGDIWYVGDNPAADIAGAHAAGMRAVWFNWEGHAYPNDIAPPDVQLERLADLLPLILTRT